MPYKDGVYVPMTRTRTEQVEEWLSDEVPTDYDWMNDVKDHRGSQTPAQICEIQRKWFEKAKQKDAFVTTDGGSPKIGYKRVLRIGMAAHWPYWKPRPTVLCDGPYGGEWTDWTSITDVQTKR